MSDYVQMAKQKAASYGIIIHEMPKSSNKKFYTIVDGKIIKFGQRPYEDYLTHQDDNRRMRFHQRFKNSKGYDDPRSPLFYSRIILW